MSVQTIAQGLALPGRLEPTDLAFRAGELTCLIGPNGSGKTSLLHALAGIGSPAGSVRIDGVDPWREPPARRGDLISYLPASRDLTWPVLARDLVRLGLSETVKAGNVDAMLDLFGLQAFKDRRIDRLSTGERSRLLIARALAAEARLLLLDEPTANLDPYWQLRLMEYLRSLARDENRCMIIALHDLDMARRHADRVLVIDGGRVVADEPARTVFTGDLMRRVFGIEAGEDGGWRPVA